MVDFLKKPLLFDYLRDFACLFVLKNQLYSSVRHGFFLYQQVIFIEIAEGINSFGFFMSPPYLEFHRLPFP